MIKLENISKNFAEEKILHNVSLHIKEGECVVLNGVSGSGKSTLLSIMGTLMKASEGSVKIAGVDVADFKDEELSKHRTATIGFVSQAFYLFESLNVKDNLMVPLLLSGLTQKQMKEQLSEVMELVSIEHKALTITSKLSGGEKQRCTIARALMNDPVILLCDEPTANLDKENSMKFVAIIKDLKKRGKTIVLATHDPFLSGLDCIDRIINIKDGKIE